MMTRMIVVEENGSKSVHIKARNPACRRLTREVSIQPAQIRWVDASIIRMQYFATIGITDSSFLPSFPPSLTKIIGSELEMIHFR
jgi:hypothetical protein